MCGRKISKKYCDTLYTDDLKGGSIAANYLVRKGSKNFIYINVRGSECSTRRFAGFKHELARINPDFYVKKVNIEDFDEKFNEIKKIKNLGIFAYNDEHLFIILDRLNQENVDISNMNFIGYDGVCKNISGTIKIPSITFDYDAMARECVALVKRAKDGTEKHKSICFDVRLEDI